MPSHSTLFEALYRKALGTRKQAGKEKIARGVYELRHTDGCDKKIHSDACGSCGCLNRSGTMCSVGRSARRHAMPLHESEAIVLRSYPLAEADRLVSFLSRTMGRVRGVAAGARRTKSRFGSTLQSLSHVRIWYYERETRDWCASTSAR